MISEDKWFYFAGGRKARNLDELEKELRVINDSEFVLHVNSGKNDFANWTEHVIGNKELADEMRRLYERGDMADLIDSHIHMRVLPSIPEAKEETDALADAWKEPGHAEEDEGLEEAKIISEKPMTEEELQDIATEVQKEFEQPAKKEPDKLKERIAEAMKNSEEPKADFLRKDEHKFVVKEFIYGFVLGLIFGLVMLGVLFNLQ